MKVRIFEFPDAVQLLRQAENKLLEVQAALAQRDGYGLPGPKAPVPYTNTHQVLTRLEAVVNEYEVIVRQLRGGAHVITHDENEQLNELAQRLGL